MDKRMILFGIIMALFLFPVLRAELVDTSAEVKNDPPVASSTQLNGGRAITLTEGTTTRVDGTVIVTDNNGCAEIVGVNATLYRSNVTHSAPDNNTNHYSTACWSTGDCTGGADIEETWNCTFNVWYYADPTDGASLYEAQDWVLYVLPYDLELGVADNDSQEMNTLTALSLETNVIDYGILALGDNTESVNQEVIINNTGNEGIDVSVDGYGGSDGDGLSMVCTVGNITIGNEEYSDATFAYGLGTDLSDYAVDVNLNIPKRTVNPTLDSLYWGFSMPTSGVAGTCAGHVQILAVSDPQLR